MPVPTSITDLSTTAASNYPAASEAPIDGDNYLRAHASFIAQNYANKATIASPTFTGTPAAPTAAADTNTTQLATTAFVIGQAYAKIASPTFTGTVTGPGYTVTGSSVPANGVYLPATNSVGVSTNSTERMRITSDGAWMIGTTANADTYKGQIVFDGAVTNGLDVRDSGSAGVPYVARFSNRANDSGTCFAIRSAGSEVLVIQRNGNVLNTNNSYGAISDANLKTDIVDSGSQWADIKAMRLRKFKMKADPTGAVQLGVVAQEVQSVSPGLVSADKNGILSVSYSVLYMKAVGALQEAMNRIELLEAKVQAMSA
jgi:hypothetical protein